MDRLLKKLCYRGQQRIAIIEAPVSLYSMISETLPGIQTDTLIDPRYLYDFILAFALNKSDVNRISPQAIHNISPDGKLWIAFPRNKKGRNKSEITRDTGWDMLHKAGYLRVSQVNIDDEWSALRFRNSKYVKSANIEA